MTEQESPKSLVKRIRTIAKRSKRPLLGVGIGLGCTALLAAALVLLYGGDAKATALRLYGEAVLGKPVVMEATVENGGYFRVKYRAALIVDGQAAAMMEVEIEPKDSSIIHLEVSGLTPGSHVCAIDDCTQEIKVLKPADFMLKSLIVEPDTVLPGESVEVEATVENTGEMPGDYTADIFLDGAKTATLSINIAPGETKAVKATLESIGRGQHTVEAGGLKKQFSALAPANISVKALELSKAYIRPDETAQAIVHLANDGDYEGSFSAELFMDGVSLGVQQAVVGANETAVCTFDIENNKEGTYTFTAGGHEQKLDVVELSRPKTDTLFIKNASGKHSLRFKNTFKEDVIVTLADASAPTVAVFSFYVRAGEESNVKVKDGKYIIYYTRGEDFAAKHSRFMKPTGYWKLKTIECKYDTSAKIVYHGLGPPDVITVVHYQTHKATMGTDDGSLEINESEYPK